MAPKQVFLGTFIHATALDKLEYLHDTAAAVDEAGTIVAVETASTTADDNGTAWVQSVLLPRLGWTDDVHITVGRPGQFFFPGFIDTHLHASQYPNVGIFGKSTLLDWLNKYTFPLEASLADLGKARQVYGRCIRKTLAHGTTTAAYYATVDVAATNLLADLCLEAGQRALVGRVCMDQLSPAFYRDESPAAAEAATRACIAHIENVDPEFRLVRPVITPRFAPSCTADLMDRLGRLHAETKLPVQTHISENVSEIALVRELFTGTVPPVDDGETDEHGRPSKTVTYAGVYDHFGLLTDQTILAHAVHLSEAEAALIRQRGSKVSHCPCSNSAITSGAARVRWLLQRGIDVGLGTDMSGGYSPSVLEAARLAALVSRHVAMGGDEDAKLSVEEVLFLATAGGARVVGLGDRVGRFAPGFAWDAQLIGLGHVDADGRIERVGDDNDDDEDTNVDYFGWESWEDRVAKWLFNGDDRNTKKVWVSGRLVHDRAAKGGVPE
ncbi:chlorohydrolase family protein [Grosmannia clavigera kw1407]|uniref:Probable guanine deaminase n=1 Tax=Grosmannia clavigera (strain kw1407 / UAMH 11150) TaxID=655863 RepID=F0X8I6_GROCL|nr:chlorohydrolase family protein [Grosmannia clavigera kw1407]EFX05314.1 chlorohydrolase family protein [Grosmannia clavigera kw1407]